MTPITATGIVALANNTGGAPSSTQHGCKLFPVSQVMESPGRYLDRDATERDVNMKDGAEEDQEEGDTDYCRDLDKIKDLTNSFILS